MNCMGGKEMYLRVNEKAEAFKSLIRWAAIIAIPVYVVWFVWSLAEVL